MNYRSKIPKDYNQQPNGVMREEEKGEENTTTYKPDHIITVLGIDLSKFSTAAQFLILSSGVCIFFLACGLIEEKIFKQSEGFVFGWYLTTFELFEFSIFACLELYLKKKPIFTQSVPRVQHFYVAAAMTFSRGMTNLSLQYLNYPTQVIFKSLKLIAIMIGSVIMLRKSYMLEEYISAILLVISAALFSLGDIDITPNWSSFGVFIVLVSLVGDAIHSNIQERTLRADGAKLLEVMVFSNFYAGVLCLVVVMSTGELIPAIEYCNENNFLYVLFTLRTLVVYAGALCFVSLIKRFGAVVATTVTTVRKVVTIVLSFFFFPKPFSHKYVIAGIFFVFGIATNVLSSERRSRQPKKQESVGHDI